MNAAIHPSASWLFNNLFLLVASIALTYILIRGIYNLFLSPLSAIPGPWYYAISDFWLTTHVLRLRQCKAIQELFEIYGPVVRVGPNKVVFRDLSTMRNVYSVHKFDKSNFYKSLVTNDNDHAMSTLDHANHTIRRKSYATHYTQNNVAQFQPEMHEYTFELIKSLENISGKCALECLALFRHLMVDVVVSSSFGYHLGAVSKWTMDVEDPLSTAINDFPKRGILRSIVPTWGWNLVCRIPNNRWRQMCDSDKILAEFVSGRVYEMRAQVNAGKIGESEKVAMLQRLLNFCYTPAQPMPDHDIISECIGHLMAGSDTTSTTITYLFWELSRRPDIMKKLQAELDEAIPDSKVLPNINVLQELPYLSAFLKEGLRLYTAVPSLLERVVPASTSKNGASDEVYDMMGYALPPGTVVATQAWSMHRDPSIFPSPDTFLPERWLESASTTPEDLLRMAAHMIPFGSGARICGGQNLAQMMLRIAIAAFSRNFNISAPAETHERSMDIKDSFVIFPSAMECKLIFTPRQQ
ncbi:cytochrome P450 [Crassisporium funariophilum]|nr:cytochrome P450 [Crassisporium funariophilum]